MGLDRYDEITSMIEDLHKVNNSLYGEDIGIHATHGFVASSLASLAGWDLDDDQYERLKKKLFEHTVEKAITS